MAPQPQRTRGACMGRRDSPSRNWNALQNASLLRVSALWMGSAVSQIDDAREAQLSKRALCCCAHFSGLLPSWRAVMDRRRLAAVAFEVSQADIINHLPAGVGEHVQRPGWGAAVRGSCSVVGLRW